MKKRYLKAVCLIMACFLFCCSCGDKGTAIVIGEAKDGEAVDSLREEGAEGSQIPGQADVTGQSAAGSQSGSGEQTKTEQHNATIRVYVCGAVVNPGVVEIPEGSRVEDALEAAGGFGATAGREAVNLADWVTDGQKLYFPTAEEAVEESVSEAEAASGLVNINTADLATLCTLPGIGESRAQDIISYRETNGRFESCEDIMKVSGIKTAAYEKIRDKITVQ